MVLNRSKEVETHCLTGKLTEIVQVPKVGWDKFRFVLTLQTGQMSSRSVFISFSSCDIRDFSLSFFTLSQMLRDLILLPYYKSTTKPLFNTNNEDLL